MIDKFNPYATLWPWIREAPIHPENNRDDAEDAWATIRDSSDIIDCRHVMVRVAVLRALALRGHPVLFALGAPWSALTDEQKDKATARKIERLTAALIKADTAAQHARTALLSALEAIPTCGDCPIGGREGNGLKCLRAPLCDHECAAMGDP